MPTNRINQLDIQMLLLQGGNSEKCIVRASGVGLEVLPMEAEGFVISNFSYECLSFYIEANELSVYSIWNDNKFYQHSLKTKKLVQDIVFGVLKVRNYFKIIKWNEGNCLIGGRKIIYYVNFEKKKATSIKITDKALNGDVIEMYKNYKTHTFISIVTDGSVICWKAIFK